MAVDTTGICAVVPAYKVTRHIVEVVQGLFDRVEHIVVVDDACPNQSGAHLRSVIGDDARVTIIILRENQGVGGAVMAGYAAAADRGYKILVKVDGDGQMDPMLIPYLVAPLRLGDADYAKGNRFFDPEALTSMPAVRLLGNAGLSFLCKLSTGYWHVMDPTNGFTALHADVLPWLHLDKVEKRYFFETDLLFRLGLVNAVVMDVPMTARYGDEESNLHVGKALFEFGWKHATRLVKRIFYNYFLRSFSLASMFLLSSIPLLVFGLGFGVWHWYLSLRTGLVASAGTIMLAALPTLVGLQLFLSFLSLDMSKPHQRPLWQRTGRAKPQLPARPESTSP